ncbi:hypothetical protein IC235_15020 [Hymenobacter sp. BT664]|uniref:Uncharacterized protein n=1 Tax=Hymenobacter montanus TaxID=2771359 RepID=A0A927BFS1_9BACT|nr:hypothetical protein [Hymenobacter montanus]MBD2769202.1 hypothetical protein [Hymenobacter montanus]
MKLINQQSGASQLMLTGDKVLQLDLAAQAVIDIGSGKRISCPRVRQLDNNFYSMEVGRIIVYDSSLEPVRIISNPAIDPETTSLVSFSADKYILEVFHLSANSSVGLQKVMEFDNHSKLNETLMSSKLLNQNVRLNFRPENRYKPTYFRCSDFWGTQTYWEYSINENESLFSNEYFIYNDLLLFCTIENSRILPHDSLFFVVALDLKTGQFMWRRSLQAPPGLFDSTQGLFINVYGNRQRFGEQKYYQIFDVNNGGFYLGGLNYNGALYGVGPAVESINGDRLYFAGNHRFTDHNERKIPQMGCFNIAKRIIEFCEPILEAEELEPQQILFNNGLWYVRTADSQLFVFKE